ncbi:hypothetical protein SeMB42_g03168 [Synchytrium endobioticum]|nr:hypothetical protein SeMB42_g03168 [Synchytrium endobioticum]
MAYVFPHTHGPLQPLNQTYLTPPPPHSMADPQGLEILSQILGWTYFIAWSISFYPQAILNWRRQSVAGLSLDFIALNLWGFTCYSFYNLMFLLSPTIRDQYRLDHRGQAPLITIHDALFACHATILTALTAVQCIFYHRDPRQKVTSAARLFVFGSLVSVLVLSLDIPWGHAWEIDVVYITSWIKMTVTTVKYLPQAYLNYKTRSTVGWSIMNILLDFTGGLLSIAQLFVDAAAQGSWDGMIGDPVKLGLGFISMFFDIIFIIQHYILYPPRSRLRRSESTSGLQVPFPRTSTDDDAPLLANGMRY